MLTRVCGDEDTVEVEDRLGGMDVEDFVGGVAGVDGGEEGCEEWVAEVFAFVVGEEAEAGGVEVV